MYQALFVICLITPINDWMGDRQSGPTCVAARTPTPWTTLQGCASFLTKIRRSVWEPGHMEAIRSVLPFGNGKAWKIKGTCTGDREHVIIDETWAMEEDAWENSY